MLCALYTGNRNNVRTLLACSSFNTFIRSEKIYSSIFLSRTKITVLPAYMYRNLSTYVTGSTLATYVATKLLLLLYVVESTYQCLCGCLYFTNGEVKPPDPGDQQMARDEIVSVLFSLGVRNSPTFCDPSSRARTPPNLLIRPSAT